MEFFVGGLGFRFFGGFKVWVFLARWGLGSGFFLVGLGFRVLGFFSLLLKKDEARIAGSWGLGFRVFSEFRVQGFWGFRV